MAGTENLEERVDGVERIDIGLRTEGVGSTEPPKSEGAGSAGAERRRAAKGRRSRPRAEGAGSAGAGAEKSGVGSTEQTKSGSGYEILGLDDLDRLRSTDGTLLLRPLRRRVGFRPFGINAWEAEQAGDQLIEPHREESGTEELYVVGARRGALHARRGDVRRTNGHARPRGPRKISLGDGRRARNDRARMRCRSRQGVHAFGLGGLLRRVRAAAGRRDRTGARDDARSTRSGARCVAGPVQRRVLRSARGRGR